MVPCELAGVVGAEVADVALPRLQRLMASRGRCEEADGELGSTLWLSGNTQELLDLACSLWIANAVLTKMAVRTGFVRKEREWQRRWVAEVVAEGAVRGCEGHGSQGQSEAVARRTTESSMAGGGRRNWQCGSEELGLRGACRRSTVTGGRELLCFGA